MDETIDFFKGYYTINGVARPKKKIQRICVLDDCLYALHEKGDLGILLYDVKNTLRLFSEAVLISLREKPSFKLRLEDDKVRLVLLKVIKEEFPFRVFHRLMTVIVCVRFLRMNKPDVIRAYGLVPGFIGVLLGKLLKVPVVVSVHNDPLIESKSLLRHYVKGSVLVVLEAITFGFCDAIVAVSNHVKNYVIRKGAHEAKVTVIRRPVDFTLFSPENRPSNKRLIYVGRLARNKNVKAIIATLPIILKSHSDTELLVVGDGPERNNLERLARDLNVANKVRFVGFVPQKRVADYLNDSCIFVFLSLGGEGCPKALLQAMATEKTIVASNIPAIKEIVRNGVEALLVEGENYYEVAQAVIYLLDNEKVRNELSKAAHQKALEFDKELIADLELTLYRKLLRK